MNSVELDNIKQSLPELTDKLKEVGQFLNPKSKREEIARMEKETLKEDFWNDQGKAQELLKTKKSLEDKVAAYEEAKTELEDLPELIEMTLELEDESAIESIKSTYHKVESILEKLTLETLLDGEYDRNNAILSIHAGTGGVDAMDWASMLLRMYLRWAEDNGFKTTIVDYQDDTEAGIKSATVIVEGENAYGYLKNEKGTHRLVRISPFNAAGKRQTSFSAVVVMPEVDKDVDVEISPEDIRVDTFRSSGAGGQHVNKTDSAIRITHIPTGIVVSCQNERSQHQNREMAMRILKSRLVELANEQHKENMKELQGDFNLITWGSQIRSYVFQPYTMVKDHRTGAEVGNISKVMDGDLNYFIKEKLKQKEDTGNGADTQNPR